MEETEINSKKRDATTCRYKTMKCNLPRAVKSSGLLHNFCAEHREQQNNNQRKLDAKNRERAKSTRKCRKKNTDPYAFNYRTRKSDREKKPKSEIELMMYKKHEKHVPLSPSKEVSTRMLQHLVSILQREVLAANGSGAEDQVCVNAQP